MGVLSGLKSLASLGTGCSWVFGFGINFWFSFWYDRMTYTFRAGSKGLHLKVAHGNFTIVFSQQENENSYRIF